MMDRVQKATNGASPDATSAGAAVPTPPLQKRTDGLAEYVKPLASLSAAMLYLSEEGNERLTINQVAFFLIAAAADARGVPMTLSEIMEGADGIINKSLANTYKVLLAPNRKDYKDTGLGWLYREPDPDDERRKYLRLTDKGKAVAKATLLALGRR